jgi:hypothetical protein
LLRGVGIDHVRDAQAANATPTGPSHITMPVAQMTSGTTKFMTGSGTSTHRGGPSLCLTLWTDSAGTFSFQWSQNTSTAVNTQVIGGSALVVTNLSGEL